MTQAIIHPNSTWQGNLSVPGDKSISHRAIMLSALADGTSTIRGLLRGEDVRATIGCFRAMGVNIIEEEDQVIVHGVGLKGLKAPKGVLDCGNSGTTMRLMIGLLAAQPFVSRLTGDASLNRRPMGRVIDPLKEMGAEIEEMRASETERIVRIQGHPLQAITYEMPMASAQVKSAILLAGLYAQGVTQITSPMPSRNHSELMLQAKGAPLQVKKNHLTISPAQSLKAQDIEVPGDISSAAFFLVGATLAKAGEVLLQNVGVNPTRSGILDVMGQMGANISLENLRVVAGEAVANLRVQPADLKAITIAGEVIPRLIDEIPVLAVAAAKAQGTTQIRDATELRVKESDRIARLAEVLQKFSIPIDEYPDGIDITGPSPLTGAQVQSHGDHRLAMSAAIAAAIANTESQIENIGCINTSYPEFWQHYGQVGGTFRLSKGH